MSPPDVFGQPSGLPVENPTDSYWHKEPSEKLLGHRTTNELPRSADVVIVGSGITGAFAAHFLKEKRPDLNVLMLEAREACWGATGRNGGHCQPSTYLTAPHVASFELRNYSYLKNLVEAFSIPCDWKSTTGVHAFYSAELFAAARTAVERLTDRYPDLAANVALVTRAGENGSGEAADGAPAWLLEEERREMTLEGLRIPDAEGAVVQWHAASLWPYKLVAFVLERLLAANSSADNSGGTFNLQTGTPVTGLSQLPNVPALPLHVGAPSHAAWTVQTPRGDVRASHVLLATNAYTSHLLPSFADLIVPTRGQVSALKPPGPSSSPGEGDDKKLPPLDIGHTYGLAGEPKDPYSRDDYLVQRPPPAAELVFGGGRAHARGHGVGVWDDSSIDDPVACYLRGELAGAIDLSRREAPQTAAVSSPKKDASSPTRTALDEQLKKKQEQLRKQKQDLIPTHQWTGIMGFSRDGYPWVGPVPSALLPSSSASSPAAGESKNGGGLHLCAGFTGHGMPVAALSAKAAVDLMFGGEVAPAGSADVAPDPADGEVKVLRTAVESAAGADGDGGDQVAAAVDLPPEFLASPDRVLAARLRERVEEADSRGSLFGDFGHLTGVGTGIGIGSGLGSTGAAIAATASAALGV